MNDFKIKQKITVKMLPDFDPVGGTIQAILHDLGAKRDDLIFIQVEETLKAELPVEETIYLNRANIVAAFRAWIKCKEAP